MGLVILAPPRVTGVNDAGAQAVFILQKIEKRLADAGASLHDVVRTRIFITDISRFEKIAAVHARFFRDIRPCTSMVECRGWQFLIFSSRLKPPTP